MYISKSKSSRKLTMVFGIIIGIIIIGGMVYLALDKKSDFRTRLASLGALALMILVLIICIVIVLTDNRAPPEDESVLIVGAPPPAKEESNNLLAILISIFFLIILFSIVALLAMREHKRHKSKE